MLWFKKKQPIKNNLDMSFLELAPKKDYELALKKITELEYQIRYLENYILHIQGFQEENSLLKQTVEEQNKELENSLNTIMKLQGKMEELQKITKHKYWKSFCKEMDSLRDKIKKINENNNRD